MNSTPRFPSLRPSALAIALASVLPACSVETEDRDVEVLDEVANQELAALGIASAYRTEEAWLLFDGKGNDVGRVQEDDALVEIQLDGALAMLSRDGTELVVGCADMDTTMSLEVAEDLSGWLEQSDLDEGCDRALRVAASVTGIDEAHASGCDVVDGPEGVQLVCEENGDYRMMAGGGSCECVDQGWGCSAACWQCTGGWDPGGPSCGSEDDSSGGGGGGGGGSGGIGNQCHWPNNYYGYETDSSINMARYLARQEAKNKCLASDDDWWFCTASVHSTHDRGCDETDYGYACEAEVICVYN